MMDWSERENIQTFRRGATCGNPSARTQLFAAGRRTSSKKEETLRCPTEAPEETRKSEYAAPQADAGPGA